MGLPDNRWHNPGKSCGARHGDADQSDSRPEVAGDAKQQLSNDNGVGARAVGLQSASAIVRLRQRTSCFPGTRVGERERKSGTHRPERRAREQK
jgi:hypothetical protein